MVEIKNIDERITKAFPLLAYVVNRHHVQHMRRVAIDLNMDFELAYLWGVLAHLNISSSLRPGVNLNDVIDENDLTYKGELNGVRLADLAQISGLPRETVRRKLQILSNQGKAEKDTEGNWRILAGGVNAEITEFTSETIKRALNIAQELEQILSKVEF